MKCPYCNNEMEQGFVQSARDIFWSKEKHKVFFNVREGELTIAKGLNGCIRKANCCKICKKIIVDYDN